MSELTIEQRVAAGVAWLDENRPGWWQRIDLGELDITDPCGCLLGQEYGHFWFAPPLVKYDLAITDDEVREVAAWAVPLGFDIGDPDAWTAAADLTAEWRRVIESRRAES